MIERKILNSLKKSLERKEIMALIGTRQVGKTTLMKILYEEIKEKKEFITFEDARILILFENDIEAFITYYVKPNKYLFIDEFQYAKKGGKKLKYLFDTQKTKIIISGSSSTEMWLQGIKFLAGRILTFEIKHISFEEFLGYKNIKVLKKDFLKEPLEEYLIYGGYPAVITENDAEQKKLLLNNLLNTFLLREIKEILNYSDIAQFQRLLTTLAVNNGQLINKSSLSRDLGINIHKITELLDVLEKTFIIKLVKPYSKQKRKEIIKTPKVYFVDSGLRNSLINNFNRLELRNDKGEIMENFVLHLIENPKFWNHSNTFEVDFITEKNDRIIPVEIKYSSNNISNSMKKFIKLYDPEIFYVLNNDYEGQKTYSNTKIIYQYYYPLSF